MEHGAKKIGKCEKFSVVTGYGNDHTFIFMPIMVVFVD